MPAAWCWESLIWEKTGSVRQEWIPGHNIVAVDNDTQSVLWPLEKAVEDGAKVQFYSCGGLEKVAAIRLTGTRSDDAIEVLPQHDRPRSFADIA